MVGKFWIKEIMMHLFLLILQLVINIKTKQSLLKEYRRRKIFLRQKNKK
jgi:hypothetical protein